METAAGGTGSHSRSTDVILCFPKAKIREQPVISLTKGKSDMWGKGIVNIDAKVKSNK